MGARVGTVAAVACAAVVVIAFAVLQYRWNRQAAEATGVRLADALQLSMINWHLDLFRNLSEIALTMRTPPGGSRTRTLADVGRRLEEWKAIARYPGLITAVVVVDRDSADRVPAGDRDRDGSTSPDDLSRIADAVRSSRRAGGDAETGRGVSGPFDHGGVALREWQFEASVPALVRTIEPGSEWLVLTLDRRVLEQRILPDLAQRYFQGTDGLDYDVAVIATGRPPRVIYTSTPGFGGDSVPDADGSLDVFASSGAALRVFYGTSADSGPTAATGLAWLPLLRTSATEGDWQLVVRHRRGGPLGQFVSTMEARGLAISYGALLLLVLSMSMLFITAVRARRLGRLQMDFATAISHELRTPLTIIGSAADNLTDGVIDSQRQLREYGTIISREVAALSGLVERVLLFVASREGRHRYTLEPLDVSEIVDAVLTGTDALIRAAAFSVERTIDPHLPRVVADRTALSHCLENLITNALKYGRGGQTIRIGAHATQSDGGIISEVCITVADAGAGIEPDDLAHVFEPFYRGRAARAAQTHGTGLGLALARQMAEAMGGTIDVVSAPGEGSVFTLRLAPERSG